MLKFKPLKKTTKKIPDGSKHRELAATHKGKKYMLFYCDSNKEQPPYWHAVISEGGSDRSICYSGKYEWAERELNRLAGFKV